MSTTPADTTPIPPAPTPGRKRLVVVGNGMAGARAVEEILRRGGGAHWDITMFGDEPYGNYNRIRLSGVLAGQEQPDDIFINPLDWYRENGITLRAGLRVSAIDRAARIVHDVDGGTTPYDTLILATGSRAFVPPIDGATAADGDGREGVFVFRTLDDCTAITRHAATCRRAAVIGGGLLGLEAARGLMEQGLQVEVVEAGPHPMGQQLDGEGGQILGRTLAGMGIGVHCNAITTHIVGEDRVRGLRIRDGRTLECDMVVIAAGIRPNAELAAECGLEVERAVVVDDRMRTVNDPAIYAVGEVAQHRGVVYGLVAPLWEQAEVLADQLTGANPQAAYEGSKLATKLKVMGVDLAVMGQKEPEDEADEVVRISDPARGVYQSVVVRDGVLVGATLLGDTARAPRLTQAFDKGTPVPANRLELMVDLAGAGDDNRGLVVDSSLPICNCAGVSEGDIAACVAAGAADVQTVRTQTRAGSGCGSCVAAVGESFARACAAAGREAPPLDAPAPVAAVGGAAGGREALLERGRAAAGDLFDALAALLGGSEATPAAAGGGDPIAAMPDDTQICNCNGVSKGAICQAVATGNRSLAGVVGATRAGAGCGSCKERVADVVAWACDGAMESDPGDDHYAPGVPLDKPSLIREIRSRDLRSVSQIFDELAEGRDDPGSKMALTSLLRTIWGPDELDDQRDARFINDRVHANIQNDGTFSVVPGISGGVTNAAQLRRIADVADRYDVPMIKITGGQRIDLLGIAKDDLPAVWSELGMRSGHAYGKSMRTVKTCVGQEFCRFGLGDSTTLGIDMEERFKGLEAPAKLKLAVAGCPRNCSEALVKDIGVVAVDGGRWEIYVGGAAGATVRKGDLLCTVDSPDQVLLLAGRFMQYYREHGRWLERTYDFVPRVGIERLREIVVEDVDGLAADLDREMERSVQGYRDPWLEATDPATANQFSLQVGVTR